MMRIRTLRKQEGAEVVEFAICSTLLFLILFGIIEFSVALFDKATLTNASREGARTGILFRSGSRSIAANTAEDEIIDQAIQDYAADYLISLGGTAEMTTVIQRVDLSGNGLFDAGDEIIVTVNYPYQYLVLPGFIASLGGALNMSSTTVMRAE